MGLVENRLDELQGGDNVSSALRDHQPALDLLEPRKEGKRRTHCFPQVPFPSRIPFIRREPHRIPHHPTHQVIPEDHNLLTEPAYPTRVAAEGEIRDFGDKGFDEGFGEGRTREGGGGPGVGGAGDDEEVGVGKEVGEGGEEVGEGCEELCKGVETSALCANRVPRASTLRGCLAREQEGTNLCILASLRRRTTKVGFGSCHTGQTVSGCSSPPSRRTRQERLVVRRGPLRCQGEGRRGQ